MTTTTGNAGRTWQVDTSGNIQSVTYPNLCPHCGRCPRCGQTYPSAPWTPWYPTYPHYAPWYQTPNTQGVYSTN